MDDRQRKMAEEAIARALRRLEANPESIAQQAVASLKEMEPRFKELWDRPDASPVRGQCEMEQRWRFEIA